MLAPALPVDESRSNVRGDSSPEPSTPKRRRISSPAFVNLEDQNESSAGLDVDEDEPARSISQLGLHVLLSPKKVKDEGQQRRKARQDSMYVQAFEDIIDTVLKGERHLFTSLELDLIEQYRSLSYESRFLYVRLFMRKRGAWFRVNKLGYYSDIADMNGACGGLKGVFSESEAELRCVNEALSILSLDELKDIAKDMKAKGKTRDVLIDSLRQLARQQSSFQTKGQMKLDFVRSSGSNMKSVSKMISRVVAITGDLVRLLSDPVQLFHRLHIVFYRTTEYNEQSLTTYILSRIAKRNFPRYCIDRTNYVFKTRQQLIEYEHMIRLKAEVDNILEYNGTPTREGLQRVLDIFRSVYDDWKVMIAMDMQRQLGESHDLVMDNYYLKRFTPGWVMTRLVFKGAHVLGRLHLYEQEHEVLTILLAQKTYRRGRRGDWYDRKALIEQHYMTKNEAEKKLWKQTALETACEGLCDPDTHIVFHNVLQRRILRLEKDLRIPRKDQHDFSHVALRKPSSRRFQGKRLSEKEVGKHIVFQDPFDCEIECSVEQLCLRHYEKLGWKGMHSENSIVTTLFALLFWDILFMPIPGVFETAFQTAPLDLATDAFYPLRIREINVRLSEIENGESERIVRNVDAHERPHETWCVGVRWEYCLDELLEVVDCLGPRALSQICRYFAEEYGHRTGGMPDLCLWDPGTRSCMFSEVKSENDRLSETQKVWLDVLLAAGVSVELCNVIET